MMKYKYAKSLILGVLLICEAAFAQSIPVKITWPTQINVSQGFELQVANDPGFANVVLAQAVTDQHFRWEAPTQGVYHWRLLRAVPAGQERGTFISGSFVAVNPALNEGDPPRVSWAPVGGADRYKLYVFEGGARQRLMVTADTMFLVPRLEVPLMIEMVPFAGGRRLSREFRFNESLTLEGTIPDAAPPFVASDAGTDELMADEPMARTEAPPADAALPEASADVDGTPEPSVEASSPEVSAEESPQGTPEDVPQPSAVNEPTEVEAPEPVAETEGQTAIADDRSYHRRTHSVSGYLLGVDEVLRAQKLEIDVTSREREVGYGAGIWVNGAGGLVISARAEYFEHKANITADTEVGESSAYEIHQARYMAELGVGYNLLQTFPVHKHLLAPYLAGGMTQVPMFPVEFTGAPGTLPGLSGVPYYLYGGGLSYGFFAYRFAAFVDVGLLIDGDEKIDVSYQRLQLEYYPMAGLALQLGGFARLTAVIDCAENAAVCLREGQVRTTSHESGISLGAGYSLF